MLSRHDSIHVGMWLLVAALVALASGCGYQFAAKSGPTVLGDGSRKLAIASVDNPTLEVWIEPFVRNSLYDELATRSKVTWTQPGDADQVLDIKVDNYFVAAAIRDDRDDTLKYQVRVTISAILRDRSTGARIWESGPVQRREFYIAEDAKSLAGRVAIELALRDLVDRMSHAF